jgi:RNA polymerase sigma-70 factor (ECF subfamily)
MTINVEELYRRYGPMVLRRCRQLLKDEEKACDAMQDTFVRVLHYEHKLNGAAPSSLLYRIATNICLNILRSIKRHPETKSDEILLNLAGNDAPETRFMVTEWLAQLFAGQKANTRTIAVMHYVDGMTLEEVAGECGLSVSGVRKRLRGLKARMKVLEEEWL